MQHEKTNYVAKKQNEQADVREYPDVIIYTV